MFGYRPASICIRHRANRHSVADLCKLQLSDKNLHLYRKLMFCLQTLNLVALTLLPYFVTSLDVHNVCLLTSVDV